MLTQMNYLLKYEVQQQRTLSSQHRLHQSTELWI
jgi:hypothetical protein